MNSYLPPDNIYPFHSLHAMGTSSFIEKKIMSDFLDEIGIETTDKNLEEAFKLVNKIISSINEDANESINQFKDLKKPTVGSVWDFWIQLGFFILISEIIRPISKLVIKDSYEYLKKWINKQKTKQKTPIQHLLDITPEEEDFILIIRKKIQKKNSGLINEISIFQKKTIKEIE